MLHHGRGTDEQDLLRLAEVLDPRAAAARRHPARAADRAGLAPATTGTWCRASATRTRRRSRRPARRSPSSTTSSGSAPGSTPAQTVLGGFSMGCVMSYASGLDAGAPGARRGSSPSPASCRRCRAGSRTSPSAAGCRCMIAHGRQDPVISVEFARARSERLQRGRARGRLPRVRRRAPHRSLRPRARPGLPVPRRSPRPSAYGWRAREGAVSVAVNGDNRGRGAASGADRRRGLRRHRGGDRAAPPRHRGRHDPRARRDLGGTWYYNSYPGAACDVPEPPLLVLLRPAARLVAAVLAAAGDPRLPARGRARATASTGWCAPARP